MGARQMIALGTATVGALAALNTALSPATTQLPVEVGTAGTYQWARGDVHFTASGEGPAVVLVHTVGLTASAFEMRFLLQALADHFRVYALDLVGFARSAHPVIDYSAALYVDLLRDFIAEVVGPCGVVAAGLSAMYAGAVAAAHPELVRALVWSGPLTHAPFPARLREPAGALFGTPLLGAAAFSLLTSRARIRLYLREQVFANPDLVTEAMVDAHYAAAHQPRARLAAQAYLAGRLDLEADASLRAISQPLLLIVGAHRRAAAESCAAHVVRLQPRAQVLVMERAAMLPHEEQVERFATAASAWFRA